MEQLFITIEGSDPQNERIKIILTKSLVLEFLELFPELKQAIQQHTAANPTYKDKVHLMMEFGDHVLYYSYMKDEPFVCLFQPICLEKRSLQDLANTCIYALQRWLSILLTILKRVKRYFGICI